MTPTSSPALPKQIPSIAELEREQRRRQTNKLDRMFPAETEGDFYGRDLYAKHLAFFAAGATYKERLFMAANRIGKSEAGAFETSLHLTGDYPEWWKGHRFERPIAAWACGTNSETTRDIVQTKLFGPFTAIGTGMVPGDLIVHTTPRRSGLAGALESVWVRHVSGGSSVIGLKTYEQGRTSFEGTAKDLIWDDEEPPLDIYTEQLYRTVTTRGITLITFTPLQGMSDVVKSFLEPETDAAKEFKFYIQAGWADVPHIAEDEKRKLIATTPAYQIEARTNGTPSLGAGAIYPIAESDIAVDAFPVPDSMAARIRDGCRMEADRLYLDGSRPRERRSVPLQRALSRPRGTSFARARHPRPWRMDDRRY
jgi:phage terminase large subunit-like protein